MYNLETKTDVYRKKLYKIESVTIYFKTIEVNKISII